MAEPRKGPPLTGDLTMDLKLKPFDFNQAVARAGLRPDGTPLGQPAATAPAGGASFGQALTQALKGVNEAQNEASQLQRDFTFEKSSVSLEQVMIASEKAKLGFTAALGVRNRLVQAYSEVMNMQV